MLDSKFAHEGSILSLVFSADGKFLLSSGDDRAVKLWIAPEMKASVLFEAQPDWAQALAFTDRGRQIVVGRMNGTLGFYDTATGKVLPRLAVEAEGVNDTGVALNRN